MSKKPKIEKQIQNLAAEIILYKLNDPRVKFVSVLKAELSKDWSYCTLYISALGSEAQQRTTMRALQSARGYIQKLLAPHIRLRHMPSLKIVWDVGMEKSQKVSELISQARQEDKQSEQLRSAMEEKESSNPENVEE